MKYARWIPVVLLGCGGVAAAQSSNITLYGDVDEYMNYMHSSSGKSLVALEDGAYLRSRLGLRGIEDLGEGYGVKFQLELGLFGTSGAAADTTRMFDRQAWVGYATPVGEFRIGRQNTAIFYRGDYIDFTSRTLGSIVNAFGVPSRYDNDLSFTSTRAAGLLFEAHYALSGTAGNAGSQGIYQAALDYLIGPFRIGYAGIRAKPPAGAAQSRQEKYDDLYANYDYGAGKIYLTYIRTNNSTSSAVSNNAAAIVGNVGGLLAGTNPDINRIYDIAQISGDYRITQQLRVGALWGRIKDTSGAGHDANGGVLGSYYDLSKRTMLYGLYDTLRNKNNGGFRPAGSAGLSPNFSLPADVNGRTINGVQLGILHRF